LLPTDEGWLDMGVSVPLMDCTKAQRELGWEPSISGFQALKELLDGLSAGQGEDSPPMRPRQADASDHAALPDKHHNVGSGIEGDLLGQYMNDHLTGATAGLERIEAMAKEFIETPIYPELSQVATA